MASSSLNTIATLLGNSNSVLSKSSIVIGTQQLNLVSRGKLRIVSSNGYTAAPAAATEADTKLYKRPSWTEFEVGQYPVWWQPSDGQPPTAGGELIIFFNPDASALKPNDVYGIAFNGGFNQPIMCGGEPRIMTKKDRGKACSPIYSIKINLPKHALSLEYSFTDGKDWDGPYKINMVVPPKLRNKPLKFFADGLAAELSADGACEKAIYPEAIKVIDRCPLPPYNPEGWKCDLDLTPGCTDEENPFYDPLANVDDGTCPYVDEPDN